MNSAGSSCRLSVRVTPRAPRDEISAIAADGVIHLRVRAAPTDGKANVAVARLLASALGVPPTNVRVAGGAASRTKLIDIEGVSFERATALLRSLGRSS